MSAHSRAGKRLRYLGTKILRWICPAFSAVGANRQIDARMKKEPRKYQTSQAACLQALKDRERRELLLPAIQRWHAKEAQRLETFERKANSILGMAGLASALISLLVGVLAGSASMTCVNTWAPSLLLIVALAYLLGAILCALAVHRVRAYYSLAASDMLKWIGWPNNTLEAGIASQIFASVACNEPLLLKKSNWLSGAQGMCVRAIVLVAAWVCTTTVWASF